jgi:mycothiol synthase
MSPSLPDESALPAPYLLWPTTPLAAAPQISLPTGYEFRSYRAGDEHAFYPLFKQEGWTMTDIHWQDYLERVLPHGLFILWHTASNAAVGTAGAIHNPRGGRYYFPFGGELAYLIVHPDHRGHGLGMILSNRVVHHLLSVGYEHIWVGVQGFRLPAIKTYLKLGFLPFLHQDGLSERWQRICTQLGWPYTPERWPTGIR